VGRLCSRVRLAVSCRTFNHCGGGGFEQPEDFNTPDFILDLVVGASKWPSRERLQRTTYSQPYSGRGRCNRRVLRTAVVVVVVVVVAAAIKVQHRTMPSPDDIVTRITEYMEEPKFYLSELEQYQSSATLFGWSAPSLENSVRYANKSGLYNTSIYKQLQVLSVRAFKNFMRNLFLFPGHVLFSWVSSWEASLQVVTGSRRYQNRVGIFFLLTVILSMSSLEICKYCKYCKYWNKFVFYF